MLDSGFMVDKIAWHTQTPGNPELRSEIEHRFRHLFAFLHENQLLSDSAPELVEGPLPDEFMLHSSHLTELGIQVIKAGYDRWLKAIDRGVKPENAKALEVALEKVKNGKA
jgi:hypothetical protein